MEEVALISNGYEKESAMSDVSEDKVVHLKS
jgi:hypothetical protein